LSLGDIPGAIASYDACLASTSTGSAFDAVRDDARENRDFAANRLPPQAEQPDGGSPNPQGSKRPRSHSGEPKGNPGEDEPSSSSPADSSKDKPEGKASSNGGTRGAGGAGGSGQAPPPNGSPDSRLDAALKDVREARNRRPPDPPPTRSKGVGKDW
jgi:Ca-activated chloride channel homolog